MTDEGKLLVRSRRWIGMILLAWTIGSLTASWTLMYNVYSHDQVNRLKLIGHVLGDDVLSWPTPHHDSFHSYLTWAQSMMPLVQRQHQHFQHLDYILVWKASGDVALLAQSQNGGNLTLDFNMIDHSLDPTVWPTPSTDDLIHIREVKRLPWISGRRNWINVTVPLQWNRADTGYLSFGYSNFHPVKHFLLTQRNSLLESVAATLVGIILIVILSWWLMLRFEQARMRYAQTLRARTSLLSERGMLASVLAHEVRSPLTALGFNLHFLRSLLETQPADSERQFDLIRLCEREIRRLDMMLDDFLTRTQVVGIPQETRLNAVVNEAIDFLEPALQKQSIRVIRYLAPADPRSHINADELRQVLLNLCANAQDAMPRGGTLVVSTVNEANSAVLLVRDSGVGIPPELQARLFEPFFTTKPRGSGLGLALVRRVVSGAGGKIFCESEPGNGTTFRVVLPRSSVEASSAHDRPPLSVESNSISIEIDNDPFKPT